MSAFHLTYLRGEDRLVLAVDDGAQAAVLTRRLARDMLKALARVVAQQKGATTGGNPSVRDAVLSFERSNAVAEAYSDGSAKRERRPPPAASASKLATAVDIKAGKQGGATLVFRDEGELLTLRLNARGLYVLMSTLLEIATHAEWDFPEIAAWLESTPVDAAASPAPKLVH